MKKKTFFLTIIALLTASSIYSQQTNNTDAAESLKGKIINVIGDSYVANHKRPRSESWHSKLAQKFGMIYRTKDGFGPSLMVRHKEMVKDADFILIIAGHNDATKIGNSKDSLTIFADSLNILLHSIKRNHPNAKIGYVTPWYVDRAGFSPVVKTIKKICRKHNIPVLNNCSKKSIIKVRDSVFRKIYFQGTNDTAHLNNAGHDLFLPIGEEFFLKMANK